MKKNLLLIAAAATLVLAGCSSEDFAGEEVVDPTPAKDVPINFGSFFKAMTRADVTGAEAAALLGNKFVVSGKKGSTTAATDGNIVFDNYLVEYAENTANTTESNSTNWEYVGKGRIKHAIDHGITSQTIKYWDYSTKQYDFIAWSTGSKTAVYTGTPGDGEVLVSAIDPNATATAAYTFTGKAADLSECYIADLVTVKKAQYGNDPVTFRFRQLGTKVRIGIYETVPGYSIKDVKFYSAAASNDASTAKARLFTTTANEIFTEGTYTVSFPTVDKQSTDPNATDYNADNNQAHVTFVGSGTQSTIVDDWGGLNYTIAEEGEKSEGKVFLGRTSNTASFAGDAEKNYYEIYLPNQTGTNLNLRVDYTLESIDGSGEKINVRGATAQVPLIYTQWKPGFAYTYLFKISDKTNGYTGEYNPLFPDDVTVNSEPAGLYPITFDAVVVNAEDGNATQETITLVSTPSITTYQQGSTVVNDNEYQAAGDIFVTVNDGGGYKEVTGLNDGDNVSDYYKIVDGKYTKCGATEIAVAGTKYYQLDPVLANSELQALTGKAALYTIPDGKTEAEVIDALQMQDDDAATGTIKGRSGLVLTEATAVASIDDLDAENEYILTNSVEFGADGNAISVETDQALRFKPAANTTYAFVYTKTDPTTTIDKFQPVTKAVGQSVSGLYRYALKNAPAGDVKKDVTYFTSSTKDAVSVFLGQTVDNLYLDAAGTTIASGYAVSGTTYYYSYMDGSVKKYKAAHNVNYADFAGATDLYTLEGTTYTLKTDATPQTGTAYYQQTGAGTEASPYVYTYCVILPQQTNPAVGDRLKIIDPTAKKSLCTGSMKAVAGMTYFDMYTQNDGVYYTKIIKVE